MDIPCGDAGAVEVGRQAECLVEKRQLGRRHLGEQPLDELLERRDRRMTILQLPVLQWAWDEAVLPVARRCRRYRLTVRFR